MEDEKTMDTITISREEYDRLVSAKCAKEAMLRSMNNNYDKKSDSCLMDCTIFLSMYEEDFWEWK